MARVRGGAAARLARRGRAGGGAGRSSGRCPPWSSPVRRGSSSRRWPASHSARRFLLHVGDCAESFRDLTAPRIRDNLKIMLQMATVLTYARGVAGGQARARGRAVRQAALQPRRAVSATSSFLRSVATWSTTTRPPSRRVCPTRSACSWPTTSRPRALNLLRAFTKGGFADLTQVHVWNQEFVAPARPRAGGTRGSLCGIEDALRFMAACGIDLEREHTLHEVDLWTSHEGLILLPTRSVSRDATSLTGQWYDCSAHLLWIGERTRALDGAHVEFFTGVQNPLGCKFGPAAPPRTSLALCERLDPSASRAGDADRPPGRGPRRGSCSLRWCARCATPATPWCGPATPCTATGPHRGRREDAPRGRHHARARSVSSASAGPRTRAGRHAPGVHRRRRDGVRRRRRAGRRRASWAAAYATLCDPRLNARQSLDVAFQVAELLRLAASRT